MLRPTPVIADFIKSSDVRALGAREDDVLEMEALFKLATYKHEPMLWSFLDAKIAKKSDKEAGAASAEAYIEAFAANGGQRSEACKKSAEAYIKTF